MMLSHTGSQYRPADRKVNPLEYRLNPHQHDLTMKWLSHLINCKCRCTYMYIYICTDHIYSTRWLTYMTVRIFPPLQQQLNLCVQYLQLRKIDSTGIPLESAGTSFDPKILYLTVFKSICTESNNRLFTFLYLSIEINWPQNIFYYNWLIVEFSCSFDYIIIKYILIKTDLPNSIIVDRKLLIPFEYCKICFWSQCFRGSFDLRINIFLHVNWIVSTIMIMILSFDPNILVLRQTGHQ